MDEVAGRTAPVSRGWQLAAGPAWSDPVRYRLTLITVVGQLLTIWITWPLWNVRDELPNLPSRFYQAWGGPNWDFVWPMLITALLVLGIPRLGVWIHGVVLLWSCLADEMRTQPQFVALWLLMLATTHESGPFWGRWFLASMWFWAGLHKLLSAEWFAFAGWWVYERLGGETELGFHFFAWGVGLTELGIGLLAILRPRWAAWGGIFMHVGVVGMLSPWGIAWNYSVIPWNLTSAIVGFWVLSRGDLQSPIPENKSRKLVAAAWMLYPLGFYWGWVDHGIAHVLYSAGVPRGLLSRATVQLEIRGWDPIHVPFPNERRTLVAYFEQVAQPGDKLHVFEPRQALHDIYLEMGDDKVALPLTREDFVRAGRTGVAGALADDLVRVHRLLRAGVQLKARPEQSFVYAALIPADVYRPELLSWLSGIPNLEELQLSGTSVTDEDLKRLPTLPALRGIGLDDTSVSDGCLETLARFPRLETIQHRNTKLMSDSVHSKTKAQSFR